MQRVMGFRDGTEGEGSNPHNNKHNTTHTVIRRSFSPLTSHTAHSTQYTVYNRQLPTPPLGYGYRVGVPPSPIRCVADLALAAAGQRAIGGGMGMRTEGVRVGGGEG